MKNAHSNRWRFLLPVWAFIALPGLGDLPNLGNVPVIKSIMLRDAPAEYAAWILGEAWGRHIVVNKAAKSVKINVFLDQISCLNALKAICHSTGLWFQEDPESGIIYVETLDAYVKGGRLNDKKFVEVVTVVYPRAEEIAANLRDVFQDLVAYVEPDTEDDEESDTIGRALERMGQMANLSTMVQEDGRINFGGGGNSRSRSGDDGVEELVEFYAQMKELEENSDQVEADLSGEPVKLKPGAVFVAAVRSSNIILLRSSDPDSIRQVKQVIAELDRPKAQVLLEVKVLSLDVSDEKERAIDMIFYDNEGKVNAGFADNLADIPYFNDEGIPLLGQMGWLGLAESGFDSRSFVFQAITENVQARIKILDASGQIERLATPNLLVADLEASRIFVGDETTILTGVDVTRDTTTGDNPVVTVTRDAQTERRNIGTTLVITPKIHADKTVTIRLMQENARIGLTKTIEYGSAADGDSFETTDIKKQTIASTVIAKSGEMVALGGLITKTKSSDIERIPLLADIPIIGKLFERKVEGEMETELIVLIRPYVMLTPDSAAKLSQSFVKRNIFDPARLEEAVNIEESGDTSLPRRSAEDAEHFQNGAVFPANSAPSR